MSRNRRRRQQRDATRRAVVAALLICLSVSWAAGQDRAGSYREPVDYGPYRVEMLRVIEGYRFDLRWRDGPGSRRSARFRLSDVHTPGIHVEQDCERETGYEAKAFVEQFIRRKTLKARDVRRGRDNRTWVGRLEADGQDLGQALLDAGLAKPYNDSSRNPERRHWTCAGAADDPFEMLRE